MLTSHFRYVYSHKNSENGWKKRVVSKSSLRLRLCQAYHLCFIKAADPLGKSSPVWHLVTFHASPLINKSCNVLSKAVKRLDTMLSYSYRSEIKHLRSHYITK